MDIFAIILIINYSNREMILLFDIVYKINKLLSLNKPKYAISYEYNLILLIDAHM